jgi:hypothetical protein
MATNHYRFVTHWQLKGTCEQVYALLMDMEGMKRWWPSLYRDATVVESGAANDVGKVVAVETKGFLPYVLHWTYRVTANNVPHGFSIEAFGELVGHGEWTFVQRGEMVDVTYVWEVEANKPFMRHFAFLLRPLFAANHNWVMRRGEEGIQQELAKMVPSK